MSADPPRGEFAWIARLVEILGERSREAIGNDTATVEAGGERWAWTIDTLVEGVHFRFDWLDPEDVGRRSLVASLSDLAAAGAEPAGALISAAGPAATIGERLERIYQGVRAVADEARCPVLGGDLTRAEGPLHVTVTALGRVGARAPLGRDGVRPGDELWVTGALGGPAAAIALLALARDERSLAAAREHPAHARLAAPRARTAEIRWLRERALVHAAIDVSDGLSGDAGHLAERSGVRVAIDAGRIPLHPGAVLAARELGAEPADWALHGGEEFELLLAAPPGALEPHADRFFGMFEIPLTRIGDAHLGHGLFEGPHGSERPLVPRSWDHFRPTPP